MFSRAQLQAATIEPPITAVVETKTERSLSVSHCLVQMVAGQRTNGDGGVVYGVVTTGLAWRFLKLQGQVVTIDLNRYLLFPLERLLSLLVPMIQ
ncbi:hypothetical protein IFO70_33615 [Phormidium tenue FACHB-886]|nr:hypothetical protein [Phormidium tenue FACHB-886]